MDLICELDDCLGDVYLSIEFYGWSLVLCRHCTMICEELLKQNVDDVVDPYWQREVAVEVCAWG